MQCASKLDIAHISLTQAHIILSLRRDAARASRVKEKRYANALRHQSRCKLTVIGHVFEKRLIHAYLAEHHKDPITNEELDTEDLVSLQTARVVKPRPPTFTSIPAQLSALQNEWDAAMLENYALKQRVKQQDQELANALYQHEASIKVIARVTRERDEARNALSQMSVGQLRSGPSSSAAPTTNGDHTGDAMQVDNATPLPESAAAKFLEFHAKTSQTRRKRPVPDNWTTVEKIQMFGTGARQATLVPPDSRAFALNTGISEGGTFR